MSGPSTWFDPDRSIKVFPRVDWLAFVQQIVAEVVVLKRSPTGWHARIARLRRSWQKKVTAKQDRQYEGNCAHEILLLRLRVNFRAFFCKLNAGLTERP